ncbi:MAG TPA: DUF2269 family protein [Solirubrobacteraceae bacterium]|nr:DUF2269 family protein [Solirubrobacteraceae bacterium]
MTFADIDFYDISVFVHVAAVVVGFGATFAESIMFPVAMKAGTQHLPYVHRLQLAINQRLASPALALIIITGIYQTADRWEFGDFWISATFLIALILGGLTGAYFIPSDRRLAPMVERDLADGGEPSAAYLAQARRQGMFGALAGVLVLLAIFLMVTKPGA